MTVEVGEIFRVSDGGGEQDPGRPVFASVSFRPDVWPVTRRHELAARDRRRPDRVVDANVTWSICGEFFDNQGEVLVTRWEMRGGGAKARGENRRT